VPISLPTKRDRGRWQKAIWSAPDEELSPPEKLEPMRLLEARYDPDNDGFDPFKVVGDFLANRHLWKATLTVRGYPFAHKKSPPPNWHLYPDLIDLFDVAAGSWNIDTLYLLHIRAYSEELSNFADINWCPVEIRVADYEDYGALFDLSGLDGTYKVFRLWCD
jgi:hypothetical protein